MKIGKGHIYLKISIFFQFIFLILLIYIAYNISIDHSEKVVNVNNEKEKSFYNIYDIKLEPDDNFVFLGDSITEYYELDEFYEDIPVVNSGVAGITTDEMLEELNKYVYQYNPTKVFILIGINDFTHDKDEEYIFYNIVKIVEEIEKNRPNTKIYVESLYPVNESEDEKIDKKLIEDRPNEKIKRVNALLSEYFEDTNITYIDFYNKLIDKDGNLKLEYTKEGLHISTLGYLKITKMLLPYLNE